jgi:hypothetical protein
MIYTKTITTPANRLAASPLRSVIKLTKGFIYKVEFDFPPGSAGLHHLIIMDGGFQVWPSSLGETFHLEGYCISFDDSYLMDTAPFELSAYTWSPGTTYDHEVQVRIGLVTEDIYQARFLPGVALELWKTMLTKMQQEKAAQQAAILETPFPWIRK